MAIPSFDPATAPVIRVGSTGDWVAFLQGALTVLGHDVGLPDGDFGRRTESAVVALQRAAGLDPDGVVGPRTWAALLDGGHPAPPAAPRLDPDTAPILRRRDRGEWVEYLQRLLVAASIDTGAVDGIFGPVTEGAVVQLQQRSLIDVDGDVGPQTWGALSDVAEAHPSDPPYGSPVHRGGGSPGAGGGGTVPAAGHRVRVEIQATDLVVEEALTFYFPVTNAGSERVWVRHVSWEASVPGRSVSDDAVVESWLDPGEMTEVTVSLPGGSAPPGETITFTMQATAQYEQVDSDVDHHSPTASRAITIDDQGRASEGPASGGGGGGGATPAGSEVWLAITTDDEIDEEAGGIALHFEVNNASPTETAVVMRVEWTLTSGSARQTGYIEPAAAIGPYGMASESDIALAGRAADEPYGCTATATAVYAVGAEVRRSEPASISFTIDAEGRVGTGGSGGGGGTGGGGGGGSVTPAAEHPLYTLHLNIPSRLIDDTMLYVAAAVENHGTAPGEDVEVWVVLTGAHETSSSNYAAVLAAGAGIVAETSVILPAQRHELTLFSFEASFETAEGIQQRSSLGIAVDVDGNVQHG